MKKLILTVAMLVTSLAASAQGIITVESIKGELPLDQWFVVRDKEYNNFEFFYAESGFVKDELQNILEEHEQDIDFPKGKEGDSDYWVILKENEYKVYVYLDIFEDGYSMITTVITN